MQDNVNNILLIAIFLMIGFNGFYQQQQSNHNQKTLIEMSGQISSLKNQINKFSNHKHRLFNHKIYFPP